METDSIVIMQAVIGSHAYGLATERSDTDRSGIFLVPNRRLLGLFPPIPTVVTSDPDSTFHEVGKFMKLAAKANPTILEQLFLEEYETLHPAASFLIEHRSMFLSDIARDSYGKYSGSQFRDIQRHEADDALATRHKRSKRIRHCFRLLQQGRQLLETGSIQVRVEDREALFALGEMSMADVTTRYEDERERFVAARSCLPPAPDLAAIDASLITIRETWGS